MSDQDQTRLHILDPATKSTIFCAADGVEMMRLGADGTFTALGKTIDDTEGVYQRFNAWLGIVEAEKAR